MQMYVLDLQEIDRTQVAIVGGKGAHLGELSRIEGIRVPAGFCVTTDAFRQIMAEATSVDARLERLSQLKQDDREAIIAESAAIRAIIEGIAIPHAVATAIANAITRCGNEAAYAVRSSATAEDRPTASFAGQQDTYLNVIGPTEILQHISRCWASLFTERAVTYRLRNGFDQRKVSMAVIVQQMVNPHAAGILFTADPVSGNRKVISIDAVFGLGEALVSGLVNSDVFKVRDDAIVSKAVRQEPQTLTDEQVVQLAQLGRKIEAYFGSPQDIEWCLADDVFQIVQSRPITTLFPIPETSDEQNHVYLSVGHQQMMTLAMKPLGLSMWRLAAHANMVEAGGRLFVEVTQALASPASRATMVAFLGKGDPLIRDALQTILDRGDFVPTLPDQGPAWTPPGGGATTPLETDPAIPTELIERSEASIAAATRDIATKSGSELLDFIVADIQSSKKVQFAPRNLQVIMAGFDAAWWLNEHVETWLGEKNVADTLAQSVPNNVTSEMGLALLDVADVIRPHPHVVSFLKDAGEGFMQELPRLSGGLEARDAIQAWLDKYGMRGTGEIDITRPRWLERPTMLLPTLLGNIRNFDTGAGAQRFAQGRAQSLKKERDLLSRLRALPDGEVKAVESKRMIDRIRTFAGYREYPKYGMVSRYFVYKRALLEEAARLVRNGVLRATEDIFFLTFQELQEIVRTNEVDYVLIDQRKEAFKSYEALVPSRVFTSEGEGLNGSFNRDDVPAGALVGLAVSAGTFEGRARVIFDMAKADLEPGDILVTPYTDPSWTPLFVAIGGLVTEVGGLMTHGSVIAREYGLPAVVGVENATTLIRDRQRIRVHGTDGYVELLS